MKYLSLDVFKDFECIGSECPDTCCAGWAVIVDSKSFEEYENTPGEFGDKLRANMFEKDMCHYMKLKNDKRCPFLNEKNLCDIYINLGKDKMCQTCQNFPRITKTVGDIIFYKLNISCPVVAGKILGRKEKIEFDFVEREGITSGETDWKLFNTLIAGFTTSIDIMQNRSLELSDRLGLIVILNDLLKENIWSGRDSDEMLASFKNGDFSEYVGELRKIKADPLIKLKFITNFVGSLDKINDIDSMTPLLEGLYDVLRSGKDMEDIADTICRPLSEGDSIMYEQYCAYFLFSHYMEAYESHDPFEYVAILVYMLCLQNCLCAVKAANGRELSLDEYVEVFGKFARFFEHSVNGRRMHELYRLKNDEGLSDTEFLISLVK